MTTADILIEELQARGVKFIATLNGHGLDPFYLACDRANMRMIDVRNEQSAGYIAEVTGRLTRNVGVCAVSGAIAHVNGLTGVLNAWFDGAPMLMITGTTDHADFGWGNFQDFNPDPTARPICKYSRVIDVPHRIAQITHEAFTAATSGRPGPVHLTLPMDVAAANVDPDRLMQSRARSGQVQSDANAPASLIDQATRMLAAAERPLLVAGSNLYYARGEEALARFISQQKIPTVVPIWDRGSVSHPHEAFMGVIGAASGGARLLPDADLIILAGAELDYRVGQTQPPAVAGDAKVMRIHSDATVLRTPLECDLSIHASPAAVLDQLAESCRSNGCPRRDAWLAETSRRRDLHRARCIESAEKSGPATNGRDVVEAIGQVMTDQTIMLIDGGNIGQWFHQLMANQYPGHWLTCGASGVVGWGLPGAMAARAIEPERPVILLSGDGAFTFTIGELECAARQGLRFVAVIADDEEWGISVTGQQLRFGRTLYAKLGPTRLDQVAEGFGCRGVRVQDKTKLVPALRKALEADRPTVIQVPIAPSTPGFHGS